MPKIVTSDLRDRNTPNDVIIRAEARQPETDLTLGIPVATSLQVLLDWQCPQTQTLVLNTSY